SSPAPAAAEAAVLPASADRETVYEPVEEAPHAGGELTPEAVDEAYEAGRALTEEELAAPEEAEA
ncbi:MAG: hypothetical protein ACLFP6_03530, partial [Spirochaetaceae bacterium]